MKQKALESYNNGYSHEEVFKLLSEEYPEGLFIVSDDGKISYQNQQMKSLLGYSLEEVPTNKTWMERAFPDPSYRALVATAWKKDVRDLPPGDGKPGLFSVTCKDGRQKSIQFLPVKLKSGGFLIHCSDKTEETPSMPTQEEDYFIFQTLIDALPSPIYYKDREGKYLGCNKAFESYSNMSRDKLVGLTVHDIRPAKEADRHHQTDMKILNNPGIFEYEFQMKHPDGELRTILNRKGPLITVDGMAGGIVGMFLDLTEVRRAEEKLRESENKFRKLTEQSSFGIFLTQKGYYRYINARFAEIFGYRPKELLNRRCLPELVHPDDWPLMEEIIRQRKTDPLPSHNYRIKGITKEGRTIHLDVYSSRMVYQGQPSTIGSIIDITARFESEEALKQAEEKYRSIFENIMVGIFQSTPDGRLISVNPASASILGYSSPKDLMDSIPATRELFVDPEEQRRFIKILEEQDFHKEFEAHLYRKDRSQVRVSLNVRTVRGADGQVLFYEGMVENITEKRALEKQLAQAQKMEAIGTLAGGIAHDFNNLLMGIQGFSTLILHDLKPDHPHFEKVSNIEKLAQSGADLTRQLLGFARGGQAELTCVDLNDVVNKTVSMFGRTKKEISIHLKCQEGLRPIEADRGQIEQALINLYVNAWQAMPGGGRLFVETINISLDEFYIKPYTIKPGDYVQVSVTDTGIGMDQKTKARIFEPFFTTKGMGRGTGLGLASVYGIIKSHGGFLDVYSEVGMGSTFKLYFPASGGKVVKEKDALVEIRTGEETVLLIDDEETILTVTREMLNLLGYKVFTAQSGKEGIALYQKHAEEIVLVVLDMIMPDMGGRETLEGLRAVNPEVRVILSSGYCLNEQAVTLLNQGCKAFLQKPFSMDVLSAKIREGLE